MAKYTMPVVPKDVKLFGMRSEIDKLKEDFENYKKKVRRYKWKSAKRRGR